MPRRPLRAADPWRARPGLRQRPRRARATTTSIGPSLPRALHDAGYDGPICIESFTAENQTIARAASIWRPLEPSQDEIATRRAGVPARSARLREPAAMKLGVFTVLFGELPLESGAGPRRGGRPRLRRDRHRQLSRATRHCRPGGAARRRRRKLDAFRDAIASRGLEISALSCHGNPLHPQARRRARAATRRSCGPSSWRSASASTASTCSAAAPATRTRRTYPNWVTCAWPTEYGELLEWQWREKVIPYWQRAGGVRRAARRPARLRDAPRVRGLQPAHAAAAARRVRRQRSAPTSIRATCSGRASTSRRPSPSSAGHGAIFHTHAKDTAHPSAQRGAQRRPGHDAAEPRSAERSWIFRTVGYGHGELDWRRIITALRLAGYDDVLSIEHEDALLSIDEGFRKGVAFLRSVMPVEPALTDAWWT